MVDRLQHPFYVNISNALFLLRNFGPVNKIDTPFEQDERAKFARTRKEIDLHQQNLLQRAFIEERQIST